MLNATEDSNSTRGEVSLGHGVAFILVWSVALLLNVFNCLIMGRTAYVKRNWPNILVLALTMADTTVLLFGLLPAVVSIFAHSVLLDYPQLCYYQAIVLNSWYIYAFELVACIALDRYLAVCHPFCYSKNIARGRAVKWISLALAVMVVPALLVAFLPAILGWHFMLVSPGIYCFFDWNSQEPQNIAVMVINLMFVATVMILLVYFTTSTCSGMFKMVQSSRQRVSDLPGRMQGPKPHQMEIYFAKLALLITVVFATCSLPYTVALILHLAARSFDSDVDYIVLNALLLTSITNPLLHVIVRKPVRRAYALVFKSIVCCQWIKPQQMKKLDEVLGVSRKSSVLQTAATHRRRPDRAGTMKPPPPDEPSGSTETCTLKPSSLCEPNACNLQQNKKDAFQFEEDRKKIALSDKVQQLHRVVPSSESSHLCDTANSTFSFHSGGSFNQAPSNAN